MYIDSQPCLLFFIFYIINPLSLPFFPFLLVLKFFPPGIVFVLVFATKHECEHKQDELINHISYSPLIGFDYISINGGEWQRQRNRLNFL